MTKWFALISEVKKLDTLNGLSQYYLNKSNYDIYKPCIQIK